MRQKRRFSEQRRDSFRMACHYNIKGWTSAGSAAVSCRGMSFNPTSLAWLALGFIGLTAAVVMRHRRGE